MVRAKIHALLVRMEGYPPSDLYEEVISRVERPLIELVLERTNNNQVRAAEMLGMNRNTLRKKISDRHVRLDGPRGDDTVRRSATGAGKNTVAEASTANLAPAEVDKDLKKDK